ncbi:probable receptor-like protein kinase At1g49730, partial [Phalaenopsis equestris]|uniref:probable receptor-like protein kinase At1g49730 n=1 Tax=Phalaenopsis equestris TaxID=78828 RepID=UPI0009E49D3A
MLALLIGLLFSVVLLEVRGVVAITGVCPLDFSWANFSSAISACSDPNERGHCCRYINALVTISIAHYANETGKLGVPSAFSEICLNSVSETFGLHGVPDSALVFCGLGPKIQVSYQCSGRGTVLEMMQSPNFSDVLNNCEMPLTLEDNCRRCLNSGILYLRGLMGLDNNVAMSMCRDAVFVVLATQVGNVSAVDMASCFFGVQMPRNLPGLSSQLIPPTSPQSPLSIQSTGQNQTNVTGTPLKKHHHSYLLTLIPAVGVVVITVAVLLLLILLVLIQKKIKELKFSDDHIEKSRRSSPLQSVYKCQDGPYPMFQQFSFKETMKATDNFSTIIGKGGFGTVYKAQFSDGTIGAVKRINKISKQGEEEFCRELELLARLHHRHLVALRGFCIDRNERFLVCEYMENGCLKDHLHAPGRPPLSWHARLQIAIDVANALEYLHFYCNPPLCHRDIKSSNILLNGNFVAKVADFGLAHASRSGTISFEPVSTDIRGTP